MPTILKPPYPKPDDFYAVDPGKLYYAFARFLHGRLWYAALCPLEVRLERTHTVVMETPQVYRNGKARLKDVTDLTFSAGATAAQCADNIVQYLPAEWKGQAPKDVHQGRVRDALDAEERRKLQSLSKKDLHHVVDAVGLGLYHLGRIGR